MYHSCHQADFQGRNRLCKINTCQVTSLPQPRAAHGDPWAVPRTAGSAGEVRDRDVPPHLPWEQEDPGEAPCQPSPVPEGRRHHDTHRGGERAVSTPAGLEKLRNREYTGGKKK